MPSFILGEKDAQSQTFDEAGFRLPTTFIKTDPCYLVNIKWPNEHGYLAVTLGFGQTKNIKKSVSGQIQKAGIKTPLRFLKEVRLDDKSTKKIEENKKRGLAVGKINLFIGDKIDPAVLFKKGDKVQVTGTAKGKGFQGVVKRHHFRGGPRTHGQSDRERAPGSIGMTTTPGRVFKGKRMAGRMGGQRVTVKGLKILEVKENGLLIGGLIPGAKGGLVEIRN